MSMTHATATCRRSQPKPRSGLGQAIGNLWHAYWRWQRRRATVRILSALDERTLKDIGIDPSEVTSYAYGNPDQRRRTCEKSWRNSSHA